MKRMWSKDELGGNEDELGGNEIDFTNKIAIKTNPSDNSVWLEMYDGYIIDKLILTTSYGYLEIELNIRYGDAKGEVYHGIISPSGDDMQFEPNIHSDELTNTIILVSEFPQEIYEEIEAGRYQIALLTMIKLNPNSNFVCEL